MPSSITHAVLASQALNQFLPPFKKRGFMIGTLFPDIRTLGVIQRGATHLEGLSLQDIVNQKDSFTAGLLFHSLLDEKREQFIVERKVYATLPDGYITTVAVKICEDSLLYNTFDQWADIRDYLKYIHRQEQTFGVSRKDIYTWHTVLSNYFAKQSRDTTIAYFKELHVTKNVLDELFEIIQIIADQKIVEGYIDTLQKELRQILLR